MKTLEKFVMMCVLILAGSFFLHGTFSEAQEEEEAEVIDVNITLQKAYDGFCKAGKKLTEEEWAKIKDDLEKKYIQNTGLVSQYRALALMYMACLEDRTTSANQKKAERLFKDALELDANVLRFLCKNASCYGILKKIQDETATASEPKVEDTKIIEDLITLAKKHFCTTSMVSFDLNSVLRGLVPYQDSTVLSKEILADVSLYIGCIMREKNEKMAQEWFIKALQFNPKIEMCAQNPYLSLFKKVAQDNYDSTPLKLAHEPANDVLVGTDGLTTITLTVSDFGPTAYSGVATATLFYQVQRGIEIGWEEVEMKRDGQNNQKKELWVARVQKSELLKKNAQLQFIDYSFKVVDNLGNEALLGNLEPFTYEFNGGGKISPGSGSDDPTEQILSTAKNYFCGTEKLQHSINALFNKLQSVRVDDSKKQYWARALLYQGCIMAQFGQNNYQAKALFRSALRIDPSIELCSESASYALFKEVKNEKQGGEPPQTCVVTQGSKQDQPPPTEKDKTRNENIHRDDENKSPPQPVQNGEGSTSSPPVPTLPSTFQPVYCDQITGFNVGSDVLPLNSTEIIQECLKKAETLGPGVNYLIVGYADSTGADRLGTRGNTPFGLARANVVRDLFLDNGVDATATRTDALQSQKSGSEYRRVEIYLVPYGQINGNVNTLISAASSVSGTQSSDDGKFQSLQNQMTALQKDLAQPNLSEQQIKELQTRLEELSQELDDLRKNQLSFAEQIQVSGLMGYTHSLVGYDQHFFQGALRVALPFQDKWRLFGELGAGWGIKPGWLLGFGVGARYSFTKDLFLLGKIGYTVFQPDLGQLENKGHQIVLSSGIGYCVFHRLCPELHSEFGWVSEIQDFSDPEKRRLVPHSQFGMNMVFMLNIPIVLGEKHEE